MEQESKIEKDKPLVRSLLKKKKKTLSDVRVQSLGHTNHSDLISVINKLNEGMT